MDTLKHVDRKRRSPRVVEWELPENRLAANGDDRDNLMLGLAESW